MSIGKFCVRLAAAAVFFTAAVQAVDLWNEPGLPPSSDGSWQMWTPGGDGTNVPQPDATGYMNSKNSTGATRLHEIGVRGQGTAVGVYDSWDGTNSGHPDLENRIIRNAGTTTDDHGVHVAGTVAAMAPDAKLAIYGTASSYGDVVDAFDKFVEWKTELESLGLKLVAVNNSWGDVYSAYSSQTDLDNQHIDYQYFSALLDIFGILPVAASGNGAGNNVYGGNNFSNVLNVGALTQYGNPAVFSNQYAEMTLLAPGTDIYSTVLSGNYANLGGTSMAAPHVTGAAALLASGAFTATPREIWTALEQSAEPVNFDPNQTVNYEIINPGMSLSLADITAAITGLQARFSDTAIQDYCNEMTALVTTLSGGGLLLIPRRSMNFADCIKPLI